MLLRASICSVTRIVPNSAAMALPTRPASIVAASTGPSSRTSDILMIAAQPRFQMQHAELIVALHRQHHADERAGERHHRQAEHADLVEGRQQRFAPRQPGKHPDQRAEREDGDVAQRRQPIDDQLAQVGDPIAMPSATAASIPGLVGLANWRKT